MRIVLLLVLGTSLLMAQKIELLWPGGAPGALGSEDRDKPSITIRLADSAKANGTAVTYARVADTET